LNDRFERLASEKARKLLNEPATPVLTPDQEAAIDEIAKEAETDYKV